MEDFELKNSWAAYDRQLAQAQLLNAQSWALNLRAFEVLQQRKASRKLRAIVVHNAFGIAVGVLWVTFLGLLVWGDRFAHPWFSGSVAAIALFSVYAMVVYLRHIILIGSIDYDGSVADTQRKLSRLHTSTFRSLRVVWMQLPFYTTFFWSQSLIRSGAPFWCIAVPVTLLFVAAAIYLFRSLRPENMHRKWVRALLMAGPELKNLERSMAFLEEAEDYKKSIL